MWRAVLSATTLRTALRARPATRQLPGRLFATPATVLPASEANASLSLTDNCVRRLQQLAQQRQTHVVLRVQVDGGGCSGFQYSFILENWQFPPSPHALTSDQDVLVSRDGVSLIVDHVSLSFISGASVDYIDELISSSFRVTDNPNSEASCGCGVSFSPKQ